MCIWVFPVNIFISNTNAESYVYHSITTRARQKYEDLY